MKPIFKDGKTFVNIAELSEWEENPSEIDKEDYQDLVNVIKKRGQLLPILVNSGKVYGNAGVVIGGNHRLIVFKELGINEVWVSIVDAQDESDFLQLALEEQRRYKRWVQQSLAELLYPHQGEPDFEHIKIDTSKAMPVPKLLSFYTPVENIGALEGEMPNPEINSGELVDGLEHECPRCGFKF